MEKLDVLIIGAGLSGIGAACVLSKECPGKRLAVLEARESIGGTWDLFRYPGIRSDSDMYTMGYSFKPWMGDKSLADGESILNYIEEAAREFNIERCVRLGQRAVAAGWSSQTSTWTVSVRHAASGEERQIACDFLYLCTGYYDYDRPYDPVIAGSSDFEGQIVHPQHWPKDLDYRDKQVVVIGSGATAVTLVPAMAEQAACVTMLQRSPSYVLSTPEEDGLSRLLRSILPERAAFHITRWKNILIGMAIYQLCQRRPQWAKALLLKGVQSFLGEEPSVLAHFTPRYDPWDQRLCLVPEGDLFVALREQKAKVVTGDIERFTKRGVLLQSGDELAADLLVKATGLNIRLFDKMRITVDGDEVALPEHLIYQGMMISDVPNMAFTIGYTNASWTLKADLVAGFVARLLNFMDRKSYRQCRPVLPESMPQTRPLLNFSSGYIQRALGDLPKEGPKAPWQMHQNFILDKLHLTRGSLDDGVMRFS